MYPLKTSHELFNWPKGLFFQIFHLLYDSIELLIIIIIIFFFFFFVKKKQYDKKLIQVVQS